MSQSVHKLTNEFSQAFWVEFKKKKRLLVSWKGSNGTLLKPF